MAIPSQAGAFVVVLHLMGDGQEYARRAIKDKACIELGLTDDETQMSVSSDVPAYESCAGWGVLYLARAGMANRITRSTYRINKRGREYLGRGMEAPELFAAICNIIDVKNPWSKNDAGTDPIEVFVKQIEDTQSPEEEIGSLESELDDFLGEELLDRLRRMMPLFFEQLVIDLIQAMGYGRGSATRLSCDFGIDGMVGTGELGFRPIYTQTKRYALDCKASRPESQLFIGTLNRTTNGAFITASFSAKARAFAENDSSTNTALIDGRRLTEMMIKYALGVSAAREIKIKRINQDRFDL